MMRSDLFNARWQQIRNHAKQWWGELTDDDLDEIQGRRAVLVGKLQDRYGRTGRGEVDINRFAAGGKLQIAMRASRMARKG